MNMKMMMHSEYDPEHYKKNIHINSNRGKLDPLIPAMFGFPMLCVKNSANLSLCCEKRIDFLLFRGKKKGKRVREIVRAKC